MSNLKPYAGSTTKLVLAFDIGTAFTGISYCILEPGRVPEVLGVTKFPGQGKASGGAKVPSLLYYDKSGNFKAAGAEMLFEGIIETAQKEGWIKATWWKLHFRPSHLASSLDLDKLPPLPPGKSALEILTDFIKYLLECTKTYIKEHHPEFIWSTVEDSVEYIFTHSNGWEGFQKQQYRQAAERAGLVPGTPQGQVRIHLLTEGEAGLHFCVSTLLDVKTLGNTPRGIVIVDGGGGTIDLSMYAMTANPISCKEIAMAECRLQGSAFVTCRAEDLLKKKLAGWDHSSDEEIHEFASEFDRSTKVVVKSDREPAYIKVASDRYNNPEYNISSGKLKLTGAEATGLFDPCYDAVVDAFEKQQKSATTQISTAFFVGGLLTNDWLWSRLQPYFTDRNIKAYRPDNHINKAVADGAVLYYVGREDHLVTERVARATYGVICNLPLDEADKEHIQRKSHWVTDSLGDRYIPNYLETVLSKGTPVNHKMEFRCSFFLKRLKPKDFLQVTANLVAYQGELSNPKWIDQDKASFFTLCTVHLDLREAAGDLVKKQYFGRTYYQLNYDVIVLFGPPELQAHLRWQTKKGGERKIPVAVTYESGASLTL